MSGDMRRVALMARRFSILWDHGAWATYYRLLLVAPRPGGPGLIAFGGGAGVAHGFWQAVCFGAGPRAWRRGGHPHGIAVWAWLLLLPNAPLRRIARCADLGPMGCNGRVPNRSFFGTAAQTRS